MKPNPAAISQAEIDKEAIRHDLRKAFEMTKSCIVEVIRKDNHTIDRQPENVVQWCRIAKEEAEKLLTSEI